MFMLNSCVYLDIDISVVPIKSYPIEGDKVVFTCIAKDLKNQTIFDVEFADNEDMPYVNESGINILIVKDQGEKISFFCLEGHLFYQLIRLLTRLIPLVSFLMFSGGIERDPSDMKWVKMLYLEVPSNVCILTLFFPMFPVDHCNHLHYNNYNCYQNYDDYLP